MATQIDTVLSKLHNVKRGTSGWQASCPAAGHGAGNGDTDPSLSISIGNDDNVLIHCHAGCETESVLSAIGMTTADLFADNGKGPKQESKIVQVYDYTDSRGNVVHQTVRFEGKSFRQRQPDGQGGYVWNLRGVDRVLYNLPAVMDCDPWNWLYICEGEKSADAVSALKTAEVGQFIATTNPMGAGKWRTGGRNYTDPLRGKSIVVLPDNDDPGLDHAQEIAESLAGVADSVRIVELPELNHGGDVVDWLAAGGTAGKLLELVATAPEFVADNVPETFDDHQLLGFKCDHAGHAECVATLYPRRFCYTDGLGWLHYDGRRWTDKLAEVKLEAAIKETLLQRRLAAVKADLETVIKACSRNSGRIQGIKNVMRSDVPVYMDALDSDLWLLNVANGTLDLRTGELRPHNPDDYITKLAPVEYNPDATCPRWIQFLKEVFPKDTELRSFIARAIGYTLTGSQKQQCLFFAHGIGANGKSTLLETVAELMGDYSQKTVTETLMMKDRVSSGPRPYIARLKGVRLVLAAEVDKGRRLSESLVKDLTGGDTLTGDYKHQNPFDFEPTHTLWMYGNHKPEIRGTDTGIWRRIRLIPFLQTFEGDVADPDLPDKLRAELPGVLAWAVAGCLDWQRSGLPAPGTVTKATDQYRHEQDELARFIAECCTVLDTAFMTYKAAYDTYERWGGQMRKSEFSYELQTRGFKRTVGTAGYLTFYGIGLALGA